jgi:competence protein ComEA
MLESAKRPLWGWTLPARVLLTLVVACSALLLLSAHSTARNPLTAVPPLVLDLNTAPPAALTALPRLGPSLVGRIVAARAAAPFRSIDDLDARVRGIGPATIAALRPHLRVGLAER